jgi:hypothetical protein
MLRAKISMRREFSVWHLRVTSEGKSPITVRRRVEAQGFTEPKWEDCQNFEVGDGSLFVTRTKFVRTDHIFDVWIDFLEHYKAQPTLRERLARGPSSGREGV